MVERMITVGLSVGALLLQLFLAPHIWIGYAHPNFIAVLCMTLAVINPRRYGCVMPFVLGLLYDLISGLPVGVTAFSLTAFSVAAAWFFQRANNDTLFMPLLSLAVGLFLFEVVSGLLILLFGYAVNPFEAFVLRSFPCYLYNLVLSVVVYIVFSRFTGEQAVAQPEIKQLQ